MSFSGTRQWLFLSQSEEGLVTQGHGEEIAGPQASRDLRHGEEIAGPQASRDLRLAPELVEK